LRQRKEDIPLLITHFLQLIQDELGKPIRGISEEGTKLLQNYAWPGNVRELENCLRSAATFSRSDVILPEDLPTEIHTGPSTVLPDASQLETSLISALQDIAKAGIAEGSKQLYDDVVTLLDKTIIELALDECSNNHSKTAELLGISRTTLIKKMKQHSITKNGK
jgi:two-component system nitrogen regulation response regulator GlnG